MQNKTLGKLLALSLISMLVLSFFEISIDPMMFDSLASLFVTAIFVLATWAVVRLMKS